MPSNCGCHTTTTAEHVSPIERIHPDRRVGDVAAQYAGALDIMKELGINHCCGAGLTLAEASALAGVPIERLLQALIDRAKVPS
jgi:iron-sulfur cluster repair protein YtfE (RIC family)